MNRFVLDFWKSIEHEPKDALYGLTVQLFPIRDGDAANRHRRVSRAETLKLLFQQSALEPEKFAGVLLGAPKHFQRPGLGAVEEDVIEDLAKHEKFAMTGGICRDLNDWIQNIYGYYSRENQANFGCSRFRVFARMDSGESVLLKAHYMREYLPSQAGASRQCVVSDLMGFRLVILISYLAGFVGFTALPYVFHLSRSGRSPCLRNLARRSFRPRCVRWCVK